MLPKWSRLWGHPLEHGQTSRGPTLKENQFSLSQHLSTVHISSDEMKLHARFPLHAGIRLILCLVFDRSCEMCHNHLWNVSQSLWIDRATALVCLESTVSPSSPCLLHSALQTFCPLFCTDTRALWWGGVIWMFQLNMSTLQPLQLPAVGLGVNHHLLSEPPLMRFESYIILCIWQSVIRHLFSTIFI